MKISQDPNPYIGPRAFKRNETLYGRDSELRQLTNRLISERILLLHSPSGAGKTSLIQAGLIKQFEMEGFFIHPIIRVNLEPSLELLNEGDTPADMQRANRYVLSTLLSIEEQYPKGERFALTELIKLSLDNYLRLRAEQQKRDLPEFLIFDQFEEVLTIDPVDRDAKETFFAQLGAALRDRNRWGLFAVRTDFVGALEPYVRAVPTYFSNTFHLELLGVNAARDAIQNPAKSRGVDFTSKAANTLVDDLRRVQVQDPNGSMGTQLGLYIEPVQLQVVCYRLWESYTETHNIEDKSIDENDIATVGDVNQSLADYYAKTVEEVSWKTSITERLIREWFDRKLITKEGIREQVLLGREASEGLNNHAIRLLEDAHIVRSEKRAGVTWFELSHDRLIDPVRKNNQKWFKDHLSLLSRQADLWDTQGRRAVHLLKDQELEEAESWAKDHSDELTPIEHVFLSDCRTARENTERERQALAEAEEQKRNAEAARKARQEADERADERARYAIRLRSLVVALMVLVTLAIGAAYFAVMNTIAAETQAAIAKAISLTTNGTLVQDKQFDLALLLGVEAFQTNDAPDVRSFLLNLLESRPHLTIFLRPGNSGVYSVASSPDGKLVASGSSDRTIQIWDVATDKTVRQSLTGHFDVVRSVNFSPNGETLASSSCSAFNSSGDCTAGEVFLWNTTSWQVIEKLTGPKGVVNSVVFSPDGKLLATGGCGRIIVSPEDKSAQCTIGEIYLWDVNTPQPSGKRLLGHSDMVFGIVFSPDGKTLISGGADGRIILWDVVTGQRLDLYLVDNTTAVTSVAFSSDGRILAMGGADGTIILWDVVTGQALGKPLTGHTTAVTSVAFNPDSKTLVSGSQDKTLILWNVTTLQPIDRLIGHKDMVTSVVFSPDSSSLISGSKDTTLILWSIAKTQPLATPLTGHTDVVKSVAFSPDSNTLASASNDTTLNLWDPATGQLVRQLTGHTDWVNSIAFSPDGKMLASGSDDATIILWDPATGQLISKLIGHTDGVNSIAFSPDGKMLASGSDDATIILWDKVTHQPVGKPLTGHIGPVTSLAFSPNGKTLASGSDDQTILLWDVHSGQKRGQPLAGHSDSVTSVAFSPDGKTLASGSNDSLIILWDAATGQSIGQLTGHKGAVMEIAFSSDGKTLASGSDDTTLILWDIATRQPIGPPLTGHSSAVTSLAFSPGSNILASGSNDTLIMLWDIDPGSWQARACDIANRNLTPEEWTRYFPSETYRATCSFLPITQPLTTPTAKAQLITATPGLSEAALEPVTWRVLVLVFDPQMDTKGTTLTQLMGWNSVDDLTANFIADIEEVSGGLVKYQVVEKINVNEFPAKVDGFRDTPQTYMDVLRGVSAPHTPQEVDYYPIIDQLDLLDRIARDEIDEVWVFGFPYTGLYQSIMAGPDAFWCNAPALKNTDDAKHRFIIMGFTYERGVGEMLESFGHRAESILTEVYSSKSSDANLWDRFTRYDKIAPGQANVGNIHFAPNSERDYDWNNPSLVPSAADDWLQFPNLPNPPNYRPMNANDWGNGDIRLHHKWWFRHLPKAAGTTDGIFNNWWIYIINPNTVP